MASQPRIDVKISAKADELSASLAQVRKQIAGLPALAQQAGRKTGQIDLFGGGRGYMSGLDRVESQIGRLRSGLSGGLGGFGSMARMVPGLGMVAGAASVGGIGEMMSNLGGMGVQLKNTALLAGTSAAGLNSMRGAARLMGLSAETADAAMSGLSHTLQAAVYGQDTDAARVFQALGVDMGSIARGATKADDAIGPVVDALTALAKTNPLTAEMAANRMGIPSAALPLLIRGREALAANRREVERLYGSMDRYEQLSADYTAATARMSMASERLGMTVMTELTPHVAPLLEKLANFVDRHNRDIGEVFDKIGTAAEGVHWSQVQAGVEGIGGAISFATRNAALLTAGFETLAGTTIIKAILGGGPLGRLLTGAFIAYEAGGAAIKYLDPDHKRLGTEEEQAEKYRQAYAGTAAPGGDNRSWWGRHMPTWLGGENGPSGSAGGGPPSRAPSTSDYQLKPVLDLIGRAEGTDRGRGYNETLGYGAYTGGPVDLTHMTLDQVDALQTQMLNNPANKLNSSAVGRYQFTRKTLRELRDLYGLDGSALMDEGMQDRLVKLRLDQRGGLTPENLSREWASFPDPATGKSYYGQRTGASLADVADAISRTKASGQGGGGSQHEITVTLNGAPPGTTLQTRSQGSGAEISGVRVRQAMPAAGGSVAPASGSLY